VSDEQDDEIATMDMGDEAKSQDTSESQGGTRVDSARRMLLKASASAPLIASLAPNPAAAMVSASCDEKILDDPTPPVPVTDERPGQNSVMRVATETFTLDDGEGGEITFYRVGGNVYDSAWQPTTLPDAAVSTGTHYRLAYFSVDKTNGVVTRGDLDFFGPRSAGQPLTGSCAMSIDPDFMTGGN